MKKVLFILLSLVVVVGICCGCSSEEDEMVKLRFAHLGTETQRDIYIAKEMGFFEENGVDVELIKMTISDIVPSIVGGSVEGGANTHMAFILAIAGGADIKFVASGARYEKKEHLPYISVLKDSPVETMQDLDGKTIAGEVKDAGVWLWVKIAESQYGMSFSQYVGAPAGQFQPMMIAGETDSAVLFSGDIFVKFKGQTKQIAPLTAPAEFGGVDYWFAAQFLEEHPDAMQGFVDAIQKARKYELEHPEEALELADIYAYRSLEDLVSLWEAGAILGYPSEVVADVWQVECSQEALVEYGFLDKRIDIDKYVDDRFTEPVWEMPAGMLDWLSE